MVEEMTKEFKTTKYYRNELRKLREKIIELKAKISAYETAFYYLGGKK